MELNVSGYGHTYDSYRINQTEIRVLGAKFCNRGLRGKGDWNSVGGG